MLIIRNPSNRKEPFAHRAVRRENLIKTQSDNTYTELQADFVSLWTSIVIVQQSSFSNPMFILMVVYKRNWSNNARI